MSSSDSNLHVSSLSIQLFRGIGQLSIPKLGRVNLLAGKNSVGKSTVLEAIALYATRGRPSTIYNLLAKRDELINVKDDRDESEEFCMPDVKALFYGRDPLSQKAPIVIGPSDNKNHRLEIQKKPLSELKEDDIKRRKIPELEDHLQIFLEVKFQNTTFISSPWIRYKDPRLHRHLMRRRTYDAYDEKSDPEGIKYELLGPGLIENNKLAKFFDKIVLTPDEDLAVSSLKLILGDQLERIAFVEINHPSYRQDKCAMVKLKDKSGPAPLKSFGDGAVRLFGVALALANTANGILLIDEVENGIHHSLQTQFWKMVLKTADKNNTQVFATTHSLDCVKGFAQATIADNSNEGTLVRLEQDEGSIRGVFYSEEDLKNVAEQGIEVR